MPTSSGPTDTPTVPSESGALPYPLVGKPSLSIGDSELSLDSDSEMHINREEISHRYDALEVAGASINFDDEEGKDGEDAEGDVSGNGSEHGCTSQRSTPGSPHVIQDVYHPPPPSMAELAAKILLTYCATIHPDKNFTDPFHTTSKSRPSKPGSAHFSTYLVSPCGLAASQFHVPM